MPPSGFRWAAGHAGTLTCCGARRRHCAASSVTATVTIAATRANYALARAGTGLDGPPRGSPSTLMPSVVGAAGEEEHTDRGRWRVASLPQDSSAAPRLLYSDRVSCADTDESQFTVIQRQMPMGWLAVKVDTVCRPSRRLMAYEWQAPAISVPRGPQLPQYGRNVGTVRTPRSRQTHHPVTRGIMLNFLQVRPMDECNAAGHRWVERQYRSSGGVRRVRTCDRCHRTTVSLPRDRVHPPAHAHSAAR